MLKLQAKFNFSNFLDILTKSVVQKFLLDKIQQKNLNVLFLQCLSTSSLRPRTRDKFLTGFSARVRASTYKVLSQWKWIMAYCKITSWDFHHHLLVFSRMMLRISLVKNSSQICPALLASAALRDNLGPESK
jgi:hypothetical protein